jgi:hypothetical protein
MADPQRAHHQFHRVGKLFFQLRDPLLRLGGDPLVDPAHAHHDGNERPDRQGGGGQDRQREEHDRRQAHHHHDQLFGRKRDVRFLRLVGDQRIEGHAHAALVLPHLLAELRQHVLAARALFQHRQPPVDAGVQADRLAEDGEIDALHQHQDADEDADIDERFDREFHTRLLRGDGFVDGRRQVVAPLAETFGVVRAHAAGREMADDLAVGTSGPCAGSGRPPASRSPRLPCR